MIRLAHAPLGWPLFALGLCLLPQPLAAQQRQPVSRIKPNRVVSHPLDPVLELAHASLAQVENEVEDYTALFAKRCRVKEKLQEMQFAELKLRHERKGSSSGPVSTIPMSVYLNYLAPRARKGREVIWVDGQHDGKLIAHDEGIRAVTVNLRPDGYLAMRGERHPVTEIGIKNLLRNFIDVLEKDRQYEDCEVQFYRNAKVGDSSCTMVEVTHPKARPIFQFYRARLYFDDELNLPIRYELWSWPRTPGSEPVLEEEYTYLNIAVNVGLTDEDFDPKNPKYRFR